MSKWDNECTTILNDIKNNKTNLQMFNLIVTLNKNSTLATKHYTKIYCYLTLKQGYFANCNIL